MKEIWKDIEGYEGLYQVSNIGRIKSFPRTGTQTKEERIKKFVKSFNGYYRVSLWKNGKSQVSLVHRIVAKAFFDNISDDLQVNHIDGNKENNSLDNLELVTPKQNVKHAIDNKLRKVHKILQKDEKGNVIKIWNGLGDISKNTKYFQSNITYAYKTGKKIYGYYWEQKDLV